MDIYNVVKKSKLGILIVASLLVNTPDNAIASSTMQNARNFYKGKVLTIIVPYGAAGGYEVWAATLRPYLQKALGVKRIDLVNKTGGGGLVGADDLYHAHPNGLTIGDVNGAGAIFAQLIHKPGVSFNVKKFEWIGQPGILTNVAVTREHGAYKTINDLLKLRGGHKTITGLSTGFGGGDYVASAMAFSLLGVPYKMLVGYNGSNAAKAGLLRGDGDVATFTYPVWSSLIKSHKVIPLYTLSTKPMPALKGVPTLLSVAEKVPVEATKIKIIKAFINVEGLGKDFAAPLGTPKNRLQYLRLAFKQAAENPKYIRAMAKSGRVAGYISPKNIKRTVNDVYAQKSVYLPFLKK